MESSGLINETLLQMKYARIVVLLANRLHVEQAKALEIFYNSATYNHLCDKSNHLHNMSDAYLADEIMAEYGKNL